MCHEPLSGQPLTLQKNAELKQDGVCRENAEIDTGQCLKTLAAAIIKDFLQNSSN